MQKKGIIATLILGFMVCVSSTMQAQDRNFLIDDNVDVDGFGGADFGLVTINGEQEVGIGGRGGLLLGELFILGGYGYGIDKKIPVQGQNFEIGEGGFWVGSLIYPDALVHGGLHMNIGWAEAKNKTTTVDDEKSSEFFIVNPMAELQLNVTDWFRIGVKVGYRKAFEQKAPSVMTEKEMSGLNGMLSLSFGDFD